MDGGSWISGINGWLISGMASFGGMGISSMVQMVKHSGSIGRDYSNGTMMIAVGHCTTAGRIT